VVCDVLRWSEIFWLLVATHVPFAAVVGNSLLYTTNKQHVTGLPELATLRGLTTFKQQEMSGVKRRPVVRSKTG
jgi:hypothetical protein